MPWIKKNLALVLGGLVGLLLLAASGYFLFSQYSREAAVNTQLEEKRAEWNRLVGSNPFPDDKNIKAVKDDAARLDKLALALKDRIKPVKVPTINDTFTLKVLIENTISDLRKEAEQSGVGIAHNYAFTFQRLREMAQFESNGIPKITEQVGEISTLCRVLFNAKIHTLDTLKRSPVLKEESSSGGNDYLGKKPVSDALVTRAPYDISFRAFSGELAEVLKGFAALDHCVVIKTVNVVPTSLPQATESTPGLMPAPITPAMPNPAMGPGGARPGGMDPALAARYGLAAGGAGGGRPGEGGGAGPGGMDAALAARYGMAGMRSRYGGNVPGGGAAGGAPAQAFLSQPQATGTPVVGAPAAPATPSVVLEEKPLRVVLQLDFVKPKTAADAAPAKRAPKAAADPAAPAGEAGAAAPAADAAATTEQN